MYSVEFRLEVLDQDDSAPEIINQIEPLQGFVPQNPETGYVILELEIRDPDTTPPMNEIRWTVSLSLFNLNWVEKGTSLQKLSSNFQRKATQNLCLK